MNHLNVAERATSLRNFTLFYITVLALPLAVWYFMLSDHAVQRENTQLRETIAGLQRGQQREQQLLLTRMDSLTSILQDIYSIDKKAIKENNDIELGELKRSNDDNLVAIQRILNEVKRDSAQMEIPANKHLAANLLSCFDVFRSNRNTIDFLREQLRQGGVNVSQIEALKNDLRDSRQLLKQAEYCCNSKPAPTPAPPITPAKPGQKQDASGEEVKTLRAELDHVKNALVVAQNKLVSFNKEPDSKPEPTPSKGEDIVSTLQAQLAEAKRKVQTSEYQIQYDNADCLSKLADLEKVYIEKRIQMRKQAREQFTTVATRANDQTLKANAKIKIEELTSKINNEDGKKRLF